MTAPTKLPNNARKRAGKAPAKFDPDAILASHASVWADFRKHASQVTREAITQYLAAQTYYEVADAQNEAIDSVLGPGVTRDENGRYVSTDEQQVLNRESNYWNIWHRLALRYMDNAAKYVLRVILMWDRTLAIDETQQQLEAMPPRGVICNGVLWLALPDDPDEPFENTKPVLYSIPLASIVNLDGEGGDE